MPTIKEWLTTEGFDWESGEIIYHEVEDSNHPGWSGAISASLVPHTHQVLTKEFDHGYGSPQCPRFIAKDKNAIYFPWQYDGATGIQKVFISIKKYLDISNETPYPGG